MITKIGFDPGYGAAKLFSSTGGYTVVAHVTPAKADQIDFGAIGIEQKTNAQLISNGIGRWWVGAGASDIGPVNSRMDFDSLSGSPELRAVLYAALGKIGPTSKDTLHLVVGVPLGFVTGNGVKERVSNLKNWLLQADSADPMHRWQEGRKERAARITQVTVLSQPHAAYLDYVLDDSGRENDNAVAGEYGVISIGHNTVEMMVIKDGEPSRRYAHSAHAGVRQLLEEVNEARGGGYEIAQLDKDLRDGTLDRPASADAAWQSDLAKVIYSGWSEDHKRFSQIIIAGGGIRFAMPTLKKIFGVSKLRQVDDPVISISRGLYKFGVAL